MLFQRRDALFCENSIYQRTEHHFDGIAVLVKQSLFLKTGTPLHLRK